MEEFDCLCKKDFTKYIGDYTNRITFFHIKKNRKYNCHSFLKTNRNNNNPRISIESGITVFDDKEYYYFPESEFYKYFYTQVELRKVKLQKINKRHFFISKIWSIFDKLKIR